MARPCIYYRILNLSYLNSRLRQGGLDLFLDDTTFPRQYSPGQSQRKIPSLILSSTEIPEDLPPQERFLLALDSLLQDGKYPGVDPLSGRRTSEALALLNPLTHQVSLGKIPSTTIYSDGAPLEVPLHGLGALLVSEYDERTEVQVQALAHPLRAAVPTDLESIVATALRDRAASGLNKPLLLTMDHSGLRILQAQVPNLSIILES